MQLVPSILITEHGELGLFARGLQRDGQLLWDVARPCPEGWEALGSVRQASDGYRGNGPFPLRPLASVPEVAATLAALALEWDREHARPAPLRTVPAEDVGLGSRVYGEVTA